MNIQDWFPLGWTCWISYSSRDSQESSPTPQFESINSLVLSFFYSPTLTSIHDYGKTIALTRWTFVGKIMSLLFNMLSRFVIAFIPRSKHLLIVVADNYWDLTMCQAWHAVGHLILRTVSWMRTGFRLSLWDGEKHRLETLNSLSKVIALAPWLSQPCILTLSVSSTAPPS